MSFAVPSSSFGLRRAGLADVPDPTAGLNTFSGMTNGGALGFATKAVVSDPSLLLANPSGFAALSPFSVINLSMLQGAFTSLLETGIEKVSDEVIAAIPDAIMGTVSDLVSDVIQVVPVVGPFFKAIFDMFSSILGQNQSYTGSVQEQQDCQAFFSYFKITQTGGGLDPCLTCPADIFYPSVPTAMTPANNRYLSVMQAGNGVAPKTMSPCAPSVSPPFCTSFKSYGPLYAWNTASGEQQPGDVNPVPHNFDDLDFYRAGPNWETTYSWRPALGQALMMATEGSAIDQYEIIDPAQRIAFAAWQNAAYDAIRGGFFAYLLMNARPAEAVWWQTYGGVPPARRAQFMAVRRGIQAASKWYRNKSDAGVSLWPIYMDLLLDSFLKGQLNQEFVAFCLTYQWVQGVVDRSLIPAGSQGAIVDATRNSLAKADLGLMVNQNWFGRGYVYFKSKVQAGEPVMATSVCAQGAASQIMSLLSQWQNTTQDTATQIGAAKLQQYAAQAQALATGTGIPQRKYYRFDPNTAVTRIDAPAIPTVKKAHGSAAVLGAAAAAAAIYLFL